jgi:prepilin-type N-terminal cleavage/methylation domain-containing protein
MRRFAPRTPDESARDAGFTLIEVIIALVLLGLIAMASLGLFTGGMKSVAHVQRQQAAVSLANSAMDMARSVSGGAVDAAKTSGLVKGRSQSAVNTAWAAAAALTPSDTSDMTKVWDPATSLSTSDQWVPITTTATVDSQTYTITTLVGTCYRLKAASTASQDCVATVGSTSNYNLLYRVRVIVRWDESSTGAKAHSYRLSTLVDPTDDPTWNTELDPFAYDDEASVDAGTTQFIGIVANDTIEYNTEGSTSPIFIKTNPSYGTVATGGTGSLGGVDFTAPATKSGTTTFTYYIKGSNGKQSSSTSPGTVTVHVLPVPVTDKIYVTAGSTVVLNTDMLANDIGVTNLSSTRVTTIVPVWDPSVDMFTTEDVTAAITAARQADAQNLADAGITSSGGTVTFQAPSTATETSFYYYLVDDGTGSDAARYPSNTAVKVTVSTEDPPLLTPDKTIAAYDVYTKTSYETTTIDWPVITANQYAKYIRITGVEGSVADGTFDDNIHLDGVPYTSAPNSQGQLLTLSRNSASMGTYVISYKVVTSTGAVSSTTGKFTVTVNPLAADFDYGTVNRNTTTVDADIVSAPTPGVWPKTGVHVVNITKLSGSTCTLPSSSANTTVHITGLQRNKKCMFTYQLESLGLDPAVKSGTKTFTIRVSN